MKILHIDWEAFLGFMEAWQRLPTPARVLVLDSKPKAVMAGRDLGPALVPLLEGGFLSALAGGQRVQIAEWFHESHKVLRAFARRPHFDPADTQALREYVGEHFTNEERRALDQEGRTGWNQDAFLLATITSAGHVRGFLGAKDRRQWEKDRLPDTRWSAERAETQTRSLLKGKDAPEDLARLLEALAAAAQPVAFHALGEKLDLPRPRLANAIEAGLRYLLVFPVMEEKLVPFLTLWPGVAERLHRKSAPPPAAAVPEEPFCLAYQVEDLVQLLVRAAEPLRVKANEWTLFASAQRELERALVPLPEWLTHPRVFPENAPERRVGQALDLARMLGLVATSGKPGRDLGLVTAPAGWQWLDRSPHERLRSLLDLRRPEPERPRGGERSGSRGEVDAPDEDASASDDDVLDELAELAALFDEESGEDDDELVPFARSYSRDERLSDEALFGHGAIRGLARTAIGAFATLQAGRPVLFTDFLRHHAGSSNPFLEAGGPAQRRIGGYMLPATEEVLEQLWVQALQRIFTHYLLPLGGASVGLTRDGGLTLELTSVGRYVLGLASDFRFEAPAPAKAPLRVQPDFDVVFVAGSPALEAALVRFAERRGTGVGILFRITRASILQAAQAGLGADEVLATLAGASTSPVPANVAHEIRAWFASCRRLCIASTHVVRCPDAATAARVLAAAGAGKLEVLSETVLALTDPAHKSAVVRACRKSGLFLVEGADRQEAARGRRRTR